MKWFPLTDPLVRWPEGAHTRYSGKQRQVIVQTKEMMHLTVCRLLGGGASLGILHGAPLPKERNTGSEEHAQPLSLVT